MAPKTSKSRDHFNQVAEAQDLAPAFLEVPPNFDNHVDRAILYKGLQLLGNLENKYVLVPGCGTAYECVALARSGAWVYGLDNSEKSLAVGRVRAQYNHAENNIVLLQGDAMQLPFADNCFEGIYGHAILHHLPLESFQKEMMRVLKPGGTFLFSEPLGDNPILEWVRSKVPYYGKHRCKDEKPISRAQIKAFLAGSQNQAIQEYQLLSMVRRFFPLHWNFNWLERLDTAVMKALPFLARYCRVVILSGQKA